MNRFGMECYKGLKAVSHIEGGALRLTLFRCRPKDEGAAQFTGYQTCVRNICVLTVGTECGNDVLDRTNVGSIPLATVGACKRRPSDMYLISIRYVFNIHPICI